MASEKRLIDANAVIKEMNGVDIHFWEDAEDGVEKCVNLLHSAPTVDAVEVVRCKDCKHCTVQQMQIPGDVEFRQFPVCVCEHPRGEVGSEPLYMLTDDFCSYGERKDNG